MQNIPPLMAGKRLTRRLSDCLLWTATAGKECRLEAVERLQFVLHWCQKQPEKPGFPITWSAPNYPTFRS